MENKEKQHAAGRRGETAKENIGRKDRADAAVFEFA